MQPSTERILWFRPTFFSEVAQSHRIANEEIFGPVLSILTFRTPWEAVEKQIILLRIISWCLDGQRFEDI